MSHDCQQYKEHALSSQEGETGWGSLKRWERDEHHRCLHKYLRTLYATYGNFQKAKNAPDLGSNVTHPLEV
jgi:hypothetical protein